jgi:hypothetical protein
MKKFSITLTAAVIGLTVAISSIAAYEYKNSNAVTTSGAADSSANSQDSSEDSINEIAKNNTSERESLYSLTKELDLPPVSEENKEEADITAEPPKVEQEQLKAAEEQPKVVAVETTPPKSTLSRGGTPPASSTAKTAGVTKSATSSPQASSGKTELLDWWKQGNSAFPTNSVVTVKDVYTGKTFKIKRTMGSNHADCEALTLEDTNIIKSIWGGFNWNIRPVHILINGRVLAASMSAMPHAGLDSSPAFAAVDNRSQNYGSGQNLDVVKGNGMDGHFDIHFLNSTRHKDGKVDSRHQEAIKIAASK